MMKLLYTVLLLLIFIPGFARRGDKEAYKVYNGKGHCVGYDDLLKSAAKSDIIFFGEMHNNPICHWLELEL
ncbi:MAG: iron-regulated protein, partial [Bacteroidota bacterium]